GRSYPRARLALPIPSFRTGPGRLLSGLDVWNPSIARPRINGAQNRSRALQSGISIRETGVVGCALALAACLAAGSDGGVRPSTGGAPRTSRTLIGIVLPREIEAGHRFRATVVTDAGSA